MTDRELLEAAAKAAGYDLYAAWNEFAYFEGYRLGALSGDAWDPLNDDGDALRLAVILQIEVDPRDSLCWARSEKRIECVHVSPGQQGYEENIGAATRRAVVLIAASMAVPS